MSFPPDNSNPGTAPAPAGAPQAPGPRAGDAESGNTASHSCNGKPGEDGFQVLWQGLDTLELTYRGEIKSEVSQKLRLLKELAQSKHPEHQAKAQRQIGERVFEVADRGGSRIFAFLLRHPHMRLAISGGRSRFVPLAQVTFQNEFLVSVGPERAAAEARNIIADLGEIEGEETVSRCDLAADLGTSEDIGAWGESAWVTHARGMYRHTQDRVFTGWSIGIGAEVSARLYDKLREILEVSGKAYFLDLWKAAGWFYGDAVKRLEFQFRREALGRFQLRSVADVVKARPALWQYATLQWLKLTIPSEADKTRTRWPLHPFWERAQGIAWEGSQRSLERRPDDSGAPTDKTLARMFKAVATALMARDNLSSLDEASRRLTTLLMAELQRVEQWEGASAAELLKAAVMLKQRKYCNRLNSE
jgi:hypothetical protein